MANQTDRVIVALDVSGEAEARALVSRLGESVSFYKVGKELFTACGPELVRELVRGGKKVFLDLKFHDIPNTVAGAVRSASSLGVSLLTVHASGGSNMLMAAAEAAAQSEARPTVLAVTVLTSMAQPDLAEIGVEAPVAQQVERLAGVALRAGCGGLVASAQEAAGLRAKFGANFILVTPGIRPQGAAVGDQARVVTPAEAIRSGASYLVVGRPITAAADPRAAADAIQAEIAGI
ncbi:MAG: orotidine-5'-phosphate decarboxylase [Acidobacteriota bacterium]|nr:orotidine-5'-phosphate decarboxylase [Acidobacteriota bacterium]